MTNIKHALLFLVVWVVFLNGCSSWKALQTPPSASDYDHVRLVLKNRRVVEIKDVHARGDTLIGLGERIEEVSRRKAEVYWDVPVEVPIKDIKEIKTRKSDTFKTVMLVAGSVTVAIVFFGCDVVAPCYDGD